MISFCPALVLVLLSRPVFSAEGHLYRQDFASVLTLFKEVMKLAKSVASGECHCSTSDHAPVNDTERQLQILDLIQGLNELADSEASTAATWNGAYDREPTNQQPHKRIKRLFHYSFRRRIAFPPGTKITMTPTFFLPFVRDLPDGLISTMTVSFPFSILLDELGLTDDSNIFGTFTILRRILRLLFGHRKPRATDYSGGHRMLIYRTIENVLYNFGMEGRDCLLRAICEVHEFPFDHQQHGLLGELLQFLFTPSKSPDAGDEGLNYIEAEQSGRDRGECWQYYSRCPRSIFAQQENNLYSM